MDRNMEEDLCNLDDDFYDSHMFLAAEKSRALARRHYLESHPGEVSFSFKVDPAKTQTAQLCLPCSNPNFLCISLPYSASSSPRFTSYPFKMKQKQESHGLSRPRFANKRASFLCNRNSFKCSGLWLFLPGLGKGKPARPRQVGASEVEQTVSRTVSMEKFECGSWASSAIMTDSEEGDSKNLYFDLPLELIRSGFNEASSPVSAAFIFEKQRNAKGRGRKSSESSSLAPRLLKAREDLSAYLEANSAY